jgi:hypothetical protein
MNGELYRFLTLALEQGEWSASCPSHIIPEERTLSTHWIRKWVGLRSSLEAMEMREIIFHYQKLEPITSVAQPIAKSSYRLSYPG